MIARLLIAAIGWWVVGSDKLVAQISKSEESGQIAAPAYYQSTIAAAEKSLQLNQTRDANYWLGQSPPAERGWEWNFLKKQCDQSIATVACNTADATSIDVCPATKLIAVGKVDGGIDLYNASDLSEVHSIDGHADAVYSVSFSTDGRKLVSVSRDVTCRVWDISTGRQLSKIDLANPGVAAAVFSPDGQRVATCSWRMIVEEGRRQVKGAVWIWNADTGNVDSLSDVGIKPLDSIAWSATNDQIVVGSWDGLVHCLNDDGEQIREIKLPTSEIYNAVIAVDVSADGTLVAAGSKDRTARVWNLQTGELISTMQGHSGFVNEVKFADKASRLVTASVDGTIRTWQVDSGNQSNLLRGHEGSVTALSVDHAEDAYYSVAKDKSLRKWNVQHLKRATREVHMDFQGTYSLSYIPDGSEMLVACYDGRACVVDAPTISVAKEWVAHDDSTCNTLSLSKDCTVALTCSWDKTARVWNVADNSLIATLDPAAAIYDCAISPNGELAAITIGNSIQVWDVGAVKLLGTCEGSNSERLQEVQFSPDGSLVAAAGAGGNACVWTTSNFKLVQLLGDENQQANTLVFSPDGNWIAASGAGKLYLWHTTDFNLGNELQFGDRSASCLAFTPDSERIAVGADGVTLIDPRQSRPLLKFWANDDDVYYLTFSPDGKSLVSCTAGGSIAISSID